MRKINTTPNDLDEAITKNVNDDDDLLERVIKQTTDAYAQQNIMNRGFMAKISDYQTQIFGTYLGAHLHWASSSMLRCR